MGGLLLDLEGSLVRLDEGGDLGGSRQEPFHLLAVERGGEATETVDRDGALLAHLEGHGALAGSRVLELGVLRLECLKLLFDAHVGRAHDGILLSFDALSVS